MPPKKSTLTPWHSDPDFSPKELKKRIEKFAPQTVQYRDERASLYLELEENIGPPKDTRTYGSNVLQYVLTQILYGYHWSGPASKKAREGEAWYKREREKIERQLEEILSHDIVKQAPGIESFVFYQPYEVYCFHDRRRKRCEAIRVKLELLEQLRGSKHWNKRILELEEEIKALDKNVDPSTQRADQFCAQDLLPRAEIKRKGSPGRPEDHLQNFLLGTVAECLYNAGLKRQKVCSLVANIRVFCFPIPKRKTRGISRPKTSEEELQARELAADYVENHAEALLEQWRVLRKKPGYAATTAKKKKRSLLNQDILPNPR